MNDEDETYLAEICEEQRVVLVPRDSYENIDLMREHASEILDLCLVPYESFEVTEGERDYRICYLPAKC